MESEENDCAICGEPLSEKYEYQLQCNHSYHYECIMKSFTTNKYNKTQCPLCRKDGGLLPLVNGLTKLHIDIHYTDIYPSDYQSTLCNKILISGKRKGQCCNNKCMIGYEQCKRHIQSAKNMI